MKLRLAGALGAVGLGVAMLATGIQTASAAPTISQTYTCATSFGNLSASASVTGAAAENSASTKISMKNVVFKVTNPVSSSVTINNVKVSVPDPNATSAPYINNSAKAGTTPAGWTAGHDTTGAFALHAGSITIASGGTVANAPLRAMYTDKGPPGTVISFKPGQVSFTVTSPVSTTATCTPTAPVGSFASVTL